MTTQPTARQIADDLREAVRQHNAALPALSPLHDTHRSRYGTRRPFRNTLRPGVAR